VILGDGKEFPLIGVIDSEDRPGGDPEAGQPGDGVSSPAPVQGIPVLSLGDMGSGVASELVDSGVDDIGADLDLPHI